jgi:type IV pilus assembly protein PilV
MIEKIHRPLNTPLARSRGITLIEVLVTMLVMSIGLLGLAGLQALMLYQNHSAYQRSQATILTYDIIDRMRTNRNAALNGDYDLKLAADAPTGTSIPASELRAWRTALTDAIPSAASSVDVDNDGKVTITVRWIDERLRASISNEDPDEDEGGGEGEEEEAPDDKNHVRFVIETEL